MSKRRVIYQTPGLRVVLDLKGPTFIFETPSKDAMGAQIWIHKGSMQPSYKGYDLTPAIHGTALELLATLLLKNEQRELAEHPGVS